MSKLLGRDVKVSAVGAVTHPIDMLCAARASLSQAGFETLMRATNHRPPSAEQLCAAVEQERNATR